MPQILTRVEAARYRVGGPRRQHGAPRSEVEIDGEPRRGAIELDSSARDWEAHGHSENPAYNGVVLHLFFAAAPSGARLFTRTSEHGEVPQVLLDAAVLRASPPRAVAEA